MTRVFRLEDPDAPDDAGPRTGVRERITREEADELVAVRALLCELRPDPSGPLGWSPLRAEPLHDDPKLGALARRIRVQQSTDPSPVPKDAFASSAPRAPSCEVDDRIRVIERECFEAAAALTWLQRHGTLAQGLPALYRALGDAVADSAKRARWGKAGPLLDERWRVHGRHLVEEATRWWRGEIARCAPMGRGCEGIETGRICAAVSARCRRTKA